MHSLIVKKTPLLQLISEEVMPSECHPPSSSTATNQMTEVFEHLRGVLDQFRSLLTDGVLPSHIAEMFEDAFFCSELGMMFYAEANKSLQAGAWFAAMPVAASALEALLLSRVFLEQERIKKLPKWNLLKKSYKQDFLLFAQSMDLGKLLDIAAQLSWFSKEMPHEFVRVMRPLLDANSQLELTKLFIDTPNVGDACAKHLREYRNLLHPAVCLRNKSMPSHEAGMTGTFLLMIAITSLAETELQM